MGPTCHSYLLSSSSPTPSGRRKSLAGAVLQPPSLRDLRPHVPRWGLPCRGRVHWSPRSSQSRAANSSSDTSAGAPAARTDGVDLDGLRGGIRAPLGDLSGEDWAGWNVVERSASCELGLLGKNHYASVLCRIQMKNSCLDMNAQLPGFRDVRLLLVCCIGWSLIAFSFLLYLQVLRSNYSVPQVKGSQYSHSVHVSRYFCCPLHLFLWTSMADVMSARNRMHYSIFIWNHDVQLSI